MTCSNDDIYGCSISAATEMFTDWLSKFENQSRFHSVQAGFRSWLSDYGFGIVRGNYSDAVAIMLVFLSRCIANPINRRYLSNPPGDPDEYTVLQVMAPEEADDNTYWEFLSEANFRRAYMVWESQRPQR